MSLKWKQKIYTIYVFWYSDCSKVTIPKSSATPFYSIFFLVKLIGLKWCCKKISFEEKYVSLLFRIYILWCDWVYQVFSLLEFYSVQICDGMKKEMWFICASFKMKVFLRVLSFVYTFLIYIYWIFWIVYLYFYLYFLLFFKLLNKDNATFWTFYVYVKVKVTKNTAKGSL